LKKSSDFSAVAPKSLYIENGEISGVIYPVTIAGNSYKGLNDIVHPCSDENLTPFNIKLPTIIIDGFTVSS
jgi:predicted Zn-dependent protease